MKRKQLDKATIRALEKLPAVTKVSSKYITFSPAFKEYAVQQYNEGQFGWDIFIEAGFSEDLLHREFIKSTLKRWRQTVEKRGTVGLYAPKSGRPKKAGRYEDMTDKEKIVHLEAENAFLAELRARQQRKKDLR